MNSDVDTKTEIGLINRNSKYYVIWTILVHLSRFDKNYNESIFAVSGLGYKLNIQYEGILKVCNHGNLVTNINVNVNLYNKYIFFLVMSSLK